MKQITRLLGVFLLLICTLSTNAQILLVDDFEEATLNTSKWDVTWWTPTGQLDQGIEPEIVTSPVRSGSHALKIRAQQNWNGIANYTRTEVEGKRNDTGSHNTFFEPGQEYWMGFSIYLPSDWATDNSSEDILYQIHGNGGGGQYEIPCLALKVDANEWFWGLSSDQDPTPDEADEYARSPLIKGEWVDFVIHVKWSYSNDGYGLLEIWQNGQTLFTHSGPNCYNDPQKIRGPQTGIYKWDWSQDGDYDVTERIMYLDAVTVGGANSSYSEVAPGGSDPIGTELFLDYPFMGTGYGFVPTTPSIPGAGVFKPYVPDVVIDETKIIWVSENGGGNGATEASPTTIIAALNTASNQTGTTIIALDGTYNLNIAITQMIDVNLISKNKWGATLNGSGGQIFTFTDHATIHEFNIIGFQGTNTPGGGYFIFGSGIMTDYNVYNIYLSDLKLYDLQVAIYGGLHSHDWTVDRTIHYNSTASYLWYMMGWHQSVINSTLYNNTYYSLSVRGCYPPDEAYLLDENYESVHGQTPISTRTEHFLPENDWTHLIINNTFGSNYSYTRNADAHIGIYYNADEGDISEFVYYPPKNIHIENNAFIDKGNVAKVGVMVFADRGINDPDQTNVASINGIFIKNNYGDRALVNSGSGGTVITNITNVDNVENVSESAFGFDDDNRDYTLSSASTLINNGTAEPFAPNNDLGGVQRTGLPDVGAYEFLSPLPVEFLDFSARVDAKDVLLYWATVSEKNNQGFEVQHSINGQTWASVGFANGAGDANHFLEYQYKHLKPPTGINYYRLKQFDLDGNFTYSSIQEVYIEEAIVPSVFPSPMQNNLYISNFTGRGYIYNLTGQVVFQFSCAEKQCTIEVPFLPKGAYQLLLVEPNGKQIAQLLIKQ